MKTDKTSKTKSAKSPAATKKAVTASKSEVKYRHIFANLTGKLSFDSRYSDTIKYLSDRVVTVAWRLGKSEKKIHYAVSVCAPRILVQDHGSVVSRTGDSFKRELGRTISASRLDKKPFKVEVAEGEPHILTVLKAITSNKEIPASARKTVAKHLEKNGRSWIADDMAAYRAIADAIALPSSKIPSSSSSSSSSDQIREVKTQSIGDIKAVMPTVLTST